MKLKKWLPEYKQISYAEYRELPDDRWKIEENGWFFWNPWKLSGEYADYLYMQILQGK